MPSRLSIPRDEEAAVYQESGKDIYIYRKRKKEKEFHATGMIDIREECHKQRDAHLASSSAK